MAKAKSKSGLLSLTTAELEKELEKRKAQENAWIVRPLKSISDKEKIKVFNELYSSNLKSIDQAISEKYWKDDFGHYIYEDVLKKLFGNDVFDKCINKLLNGKPIVKVEKA